MSLCFIAGAVTKTLKVSAFALIWSHSVDKTDWQKHWRVTPVQLTLVDARIQGAGPGDDPPADARLINGWWRWRPAPTPRSEVILGHSGKTGEWRVCASGRRMTLSAIFGRRLAEGSIVMKPCSRAQ